MSKKRKRKKRLLIGVSVLNIIIIMYIIVAFSDISFIKKWRTLYIETAMSTTSHKWLATWFFPDMIIDEVMDARRQGMDSQLSLNSEWDDEYEDDNYPTVTKKPEIKDDKTLFYEEYWELDSESFRNYLDNNNELLSNGYDNLLIEDIDWELELETSKGDKVLVVDVANNLLIVGVQNTGYVGKMAIVKDPSQVDLVISSQLGSHGEEAITFNQRYNAVITINASGFVDVGGHGSGGNVKGSVVREGKEYGHPNGSNWKFFGFKNNNRMYITNYDSSIVSEYRWAMEFFPALIVNGESVVDGSFGMGIQPRSSVGQAENGDFMMLVIDGRQPGYSYGTTVKECCEILMRYNAVQGMNLDGGSSSVMIYKGKQITKSSSVSGRGRYMPDAFIIKEAK